MTIADGLSRHTLPTKTSRQPEGHVAHGVLVDQFIASFDEPPEEVVLDFDRF